MRLSVKTITENHGRGKNGEEMIKLGNMRTNEFKEKLSTKSVICFCAGHGLKELCCIYPQLTGKILYVVDNYRHGEKIVLDSHEISILSMDEIKENMHDTLGVITSLQFADEIIAQLDKVRACDGLEVFVPALFQAEDQGMALKKGGKAIVPRKIHYFWFGRKAIPKQFQKNIESWERTCPDYEIVRWDESNYDYRKNPYMRQAYESEKWGFVPDYARLDVINTYGGIYLDTDVELIKPLDDLLQFKLFCGFEDLKMVNFGLGFGGTAENVILQEMMELYEEIDFIKPDKTMNLIPSPAYQTKILAKHGLIRNGNSQYHEDFVAFSSEFFSPINAYGFGGITENTFSIHQYAATWFDVEQKAQKDRMLKPVKYVMDRMNSEYETRKHPIQLAEQAEINEGQEQGKGV